MAKCSVPRQFYEYDLVWKNKDDKLKGDYFKFSSMLCLSESYKLPNAKL